MAIDHSASFLSVALLGILVFTSGCNQSDEIVVHRLPKTSKQTDDGPDRMIVGIGFHQGNGWYFKLVGQQELVDQHADDFRTFLKSVEFAEEGPPSWDTPDDWNEIPGSGSMRKATFLIGEEELELAVTSFPFVGSMNEGLLLNVNRWRGHMSLGDINADQVSDEIEGLDDAKETILIMDVIGKFTGGMSGGAPFAKSPHSARPSPPPREKEPTVKRPELDFELPEGWTKAAGSMFSLYAFEIGEGDRSAKMSISAMTKTNTWESSLGMWKGQVGQADLSDADAEKVTKPVTIDDTQGKQIALESPDDAEKPQAMVAVRVEKGDYAWFFKLSGDRETVEKERENLDQFLKSVKFK